MFHDEVGGFRRDHAFLFRFRAGASIAQTGSMSLPTRHAMSPPPSPERDGGLSGIGLATFPSAALEGTCRESSTHSRDVSCLNGQTFLNKLVGTVFHSV